MGCDEPATTEAPPSRVIAVGTDEEAPDLDAFCETRPNREISLPELTRDCTTWPPENNAWRWINIWATWCAPCVEELPMIREWTDRLASDGVDVELLLLSADQSDEAIEQFAREHTEAQGSHRVSDTEALPAWVASAGLDEGAPLPIHLFVDSDRRVRCARTGALRDRDFAAVRAVMAD